MKRQLAFIDEFGNNGLDFTKSGSSTHFIVTAILFDEDTFNEEEAKIEFVRKKYFQTGEIKSSKVGSDDKRRIMILSDFSDIKYHVFSIVVDKRELSGEGFKYKPVFYKFLHSLVDRELFKVFPKIQIVADEHGGDGFKQGFIKYIQTNHVADLFNQEFNLSNSKSKLAIQLADIITGTIARCYDERKVSDNKQQFLNILKSKILEIRFWPPDYRTINFINSARSEHDNTVSELSVSLVNQFIGKHGSSNIPSEIQQIICLRYMLFYYRNINAEKYIPTFELIKILELSKGREITMHYFRSKIIAKLRDAGILISSSSKGYKLPSGVNDLLDFVKHSNSYIKPMINRIVSCRNTVNLATKGNIDIIDNSEFDYLKGDNSTLI